MTQHSIDTSPHVSDEVRKTTCYMCACRCGINVHLRDGKIRYIEGNRDHPVNQGVLCAKGSAGIMQHYAPSRLSTPMKRVGPRGAGEFEPISWEEALQTATDWLQPIRETDPAKLAFFTGRDQSQGLTGWWAQMFGTHNFAAHGGFCSVNMAAAGIYTMGGAFWEFGSPDWERTKLFHDLLFLQIKQKILIVLKIFFYKNRLNLFCSSQHFSFSRRAVQSLNLKTYFL